MGIERAGTPDHKFQYNGKEKQMELGLNWMDYGFRNYDPQIGRWHSPDAVAHWAESLSPYRYGLNNPVRYVDLLGLWEAVNGGYSTNKQEDIERFMLYLQAEKATSKEDPSGSQIGNFIEGEMSGGLGKLSDGSTLTSDMSIKGYRSGSNTRYYANKSTVENVWHDVQGTLTPDALDPRTLNKNFPGPSYPGGSNPRKYNGEYDYSHIPTNFSEYPAIGHDRRYDNLGINGALGLVTDTRAIGADWTFVAQELRIASYPIFSSGTRARAALMGIGLGVAATSKTLYQLSKPLGFAEIMMWHNVSSVGVTNNPSK